MQYITIDLAAELLGIDKEGVKKNYQRANIRHRENNGRIELQVKSLLNYYSEYKETFNRMCIEKGIFRYHAKAGKDKMFRSVIDHTKMMSKRDIIEIAVRECTKAATEGEKIAICDALKAEFPGCRGLDHKSIYKRMQKARFIGFDGASGRKMRMDKGILRENYRDISVLKNMFLKYFVSQGKGAENDQVGGNLSEAYRLTIWNYCREKGHKVQDWKNHRMLKEDAEKLLGYKLPAYHYFVGMVHKQGIVKAARMKRWQYNEYMTKVLPMHNFDRWRQWGFMDVWESDNHKLHENAKIALVDGDKAVEKTVQMVGWMEGKTGFMMRFDLHFNSINSNKFCLSLMKIVEQYGRPNSYFLLDHGMENKNERAENSILRLYDLSELNENPEVIRRAKGYHGWQKAIEGLWRQFVSYLKDSPGYSGGDRISSPKTQLGTKPVAAVHTMQELHQLTAQIWEAYNHEVIEIDVRYLSPVSIEDMRNEGQGVRQVSEYVYKIRRIDIFNCFMKKHYKRVYSEDYLTMLFGVPDHVKVSHAGVHKTFFGEKFLYLPSATNAMALLDYYGRDVEVRFDPTNEYTLSKMFVFDPDNGKFITTVYSDLLRGYNKDQAEQYAKMKAKINRILREFNEEFATVNVLKDRLDMALQDKTEITDQVKGKIIHFNPDMHRFSEERDREEEAVMEMEVLRHEADEMEWVHSHQEGGWINTTTGEFRTEDPTINQ